MLSGSLLCVNFSNLFTCTVVCYIAAGVLPGTIVHLQVVAPQILDVFTCGRYVDDAYCACGRRYSQGPQPHDFDGQRALDFVLDNPTLQDFNRTLLIDIKLLNIRK